MRKMHAARRSWAERSLCAEESFNLTEEACRKEQGDAKGEEEEDDYSPSAIVPERRTEAQEEKETAAVY